MSRMRFIKGFLRTLVGLDDRTSAWWGIKFSPPRCPSGYWQYRCTQDSGHAGDCSAVGDDGKAYEWATPPRSAT